MALVLDPWIFASGFVGALAPELGRWYRAGAVHRNSIPLSYTFISIGFFFLGGFVAVVLPASTYWGAFYTGISTPILISNIAGIPPVARAAPGTRRAFRYKRPRPLAKAPPTPPPWPPPEVTLPGPPGPQLANLYCKAGPEQGKNFPLFGRSILVGRGTGNDVSLSDNTVSRKHCRVAFDGEDFYIEDIGSTNGTSVNRQRILPGDRRRLEEGAEIGLGPNTYLEFRKITPSMPVEVMHRPVVVEVRRREGR